MQVILLGIFLLLLESFEFRKKEMSPGQSKDNKVIPSSVYGVFWEKNLILMCLF